MREDGDCNFHSTYTTHHFPRSTPPPHVCLSAFCFVLALLSKGNAKSVSDVSSGNEKFKENKMKK